MAAARQIRLPQSQSESEALLAQTRETYRLEQSSLGGLKFGGVRDIGAALEQAGHYGVLPGETLIAIATTLAGTRQLRRNIDDQEDLPILQALVAELRTYPELEQEINRCIDDRGQVADRASPQLASIRQQMRTLRQRIYERLQRILQRQANAVQEALITQRGDRFVIPVKAPQKDAIPGIVHDTSTSGATLYVEPHSVVESGNQLRQLQRQEEAEAEAVRRQLSAQVAEVQPDLERLLVIVTTLDLATARARYSAWLEANPPRFIQADEATTLRQLRHPLLVWQQRHEQGDAVVPTDLTIHPDLRVVAITGPNTGGKTVTLKTLGLAVLMAKIGLFIPAREPVELPWFEQVLADIGDEQSIEQSLSTFSGHIRRIERILDAIAQLEDQNGDPAKDPANTLVVLDEVGAGTDPSEGSALAIALLQHLADHSRLTVATTHFGELKALKYQDDRFENASVEFDVESLSPTYRLLWGIPGRSNALAIARRLGLNPQILDQAKAHLGAGRTEDVNQVIAGLEAQRRRQEARAEEAEQLVAQAEKFYTEVEQRAQLLRDREQSLKQQQQQAVQAAIAEAKTEIARVIRQLQQGRTTAQSAQNATAAVDRLAQQHLPTGNHPAKTSRRSYRPEPGERVRLLSLGSQIAEVLSPPDDDGRLSVRFGLMKMTVDLADIESLSGQKAEPPPKPEPTPVLPPVSVSAAPTAPAIRTAQNTLDLRGQRVIEAEGALEDFIARANGPIWIIHGHGTGKLRRGVQDYLERHPLVQRYEAAEPRAGGAGVTVAYLTTS